MNPENALIPKWCVVEDDVIAIEIYPARPVGDDNEPYVNLHVPPKWRKRSKFIGKLKAPTGFQHVKDSDIKLTDETSVFMDVPYQNYVGADGLFDSTGFIEAFRAATKSLVAMEKEIDQILERLG